MSLETWKAEFYPVEAAMVPQADAVAHSLQKWRGLLPENMRKHNVRLMGKDVTDGCYLWKRLTFDTSTCALCVCFTCGDCPLGESRWRARKCNSAYDEFCRTGKPDAMIKALEEACSS